MTDDERPDDKRPPTEEEWRQWAEANGWEYSEGKGPKGNPPTEAGHRSGLVRQWTDPDGTMHREISLRYHGDHGEELTDDERERLGDFLPDVWAEFEKTKLGGRPFSRRLADTDKGPGKPGRPVRPDPEHFSLNNREHAKTLEKAWRDAAPYPDEFGVMHPRTWERIASKAYRSTTTIREVFDRDEFDREHFFDHGELVRLPKPAGEVSEE